jgi:hypothetical protein
LPPLTGSSGVETPADGGTLVAADIPSPATSHAGRRLLLFGDEQCPTVVCVAARYVNRFAHVAQIRRRQPTASGLRFCWCPSWTACPVTGF